MASTHDSMFNPLLTNFPPAQAPDPRNVVITPRTQELQQHQHQHRGGLEIVEPPRHRFNELEAKLLMGWFSEAKYRISILHVQSANRYALWDLCLGMPAIIVCTVAASMAMGTERTQDGEVFRYFLCILSVFGTILSFIFANTQFIQRATQHKNSWTAYLTFANDAEAALARHAAGDRWFHAPQHLDMLYERWKELKGPSIDLSTLTDIPQHEIPKTAEFVIRRWQSYAERQLMRNQIAAREYDRWFFVWRALWMVVVALCSAASLGTFLPNNTRWPVVFSYCSLILNILAIIIISAMSFQRFTSMSAQHQLVALKCRALQDRAGRLLASRPRHGMSSEQMMAIAIETLRPMINDIVVAVPPIPTYLSARIESIMPPRTVQYSKPMGIQIVSDKGPSSQGPLVGGAGFQSPENVRSQEDQVVPASPQ